MIALYPGSFDPITLGHIDLIERTSALFSQVFVGIGINPRRTPLFSLAERLHFAAHSTAHLPNVHVESFHDLLVDYCRRIGARVIIRGLRAVTDFEYELHVAHVNSDLAPDIDTLFLPTRTKHGFVSASLVREIGCYGGDVSRYAPAIVCTALRAKHNATLHSFT